MQARIDRRMFCKAASLVASAAWLEGIAETSSPLHASQGSAIGVDGAALAANEIRVQLRWHGNRCRPLVTNVSGKAVRLREVVLLDYRHNLAPQTGVYGEGFQMLTQTVGTLAAMREIGLGEQEHYRIPGPTDATVVTSLLTLSPPDGGHFVLAYTSCRKFIGRFYLSDGRISAVVDTEGLILEPGHSWELEGLTYLSGNDREALLSQVAQLLEESHPNRTFQPVPAGWCSWYCFGRSTTAANVSSNLDVIAQRVPQLRYVQIDDGYQPAMGDWLDTGKSFDGKIRTVLQDIRKRGFEPAIWVAPFIADTKSCVLREHPDWFVKNSSGDPMPAAEVTFTGWGGGGWYCLDGTHPEVQQHLENVFRVMREQWGCSYFKLDANFWGAVHGGRFHDPAATRIEAYRRGMQAVRRGAASSFLLGCNHPIWPSLGLIDGSRSSNDISRKWKSVANCMEESMQRNWQNGKLWWNDPDAVLLTNRTAGRMQGALTDDEFRFHATSAYASGGLILSGDDLTTIPSDRLAMLGKLLPPTTVAAVFDDAMTLEIGRIHLPAATRIAIFNRDNASRKFVVHLRRSYRVTEVWTEQEFGIQRGDYTVEVPPHGARLLHCVPAT
jgi:alpha-galactosidase